MMAMSTGGRGHWPSRSAGVCTAGGIMEHMASDETMTHLSFSIRAAPGLKTRIRTAPTARPCCSTTKEYGDMVVKWPDARTAAMIAMSTGKAVAYALDTLQERGLCSWRRATIATRA